MTGAAPVWGLKTKNMESYSLAAAGMRGNCRAPEARHFILCRTNPMIVDLG